MERRPHTFYWVLILIGVSVVAFIMGTQFVLSSNDVIGTASFMAKHFNNTLMELPPRLFKMPGQLESESPYGDDIDLLDELFSKMQLQSSRNALNHDGEYFLLLNHMNSRTFPQFNMLTYSNTHGDVCYHCMSTGAGLGNNLLHYWFSRGLAFFANMKYECYFEDNEINTFNMSDYLRGKLEKNMIKCAVKANRWQNADAFSLQRNLPQSSDKTFARFLLDKLKRNAANDGDVDWYREHDKYVKIEEYMLGLMVAAVVPENHKQNITDFDGDLVLEFERMRTYEGKLWGNSRYPWSGARWKLLYENDVMREVMATETEAAFAKFDKSEREAFALIKDGKYSQGPNDIVVHIRCGDIIRVGVRYNGFHALSYYESAKTQIQQRLQLQKKNEGAINGSVYVVMSILDNAEIYAQREQRFMDNKMEDHRKCRQLGNYLMHSFKTKTFSEYNGVYLVSNGSMYEDFYTIMRASNVICGVSTYCISAALCNTNANTIVWPDSVDQIIGLLPSGIVLARNKWKTSQAIKRDNLSMKQLADWIDQN